MSEQINQPTNQPASQPANQPTSKRLTGRTNERTNEPAGPIVAVFAQPQCAHVVANLKPALEVLQTRQRSFGGHLRTASWEEEQEEEDVQARKQTCKRCTATLHTHAQH